MLLLKWIAWNGTAFYGKTVLTLNWIVIYIYRERTVLTKINKNGFGVT